MTKKQNILMIGVELDVDVDVDSAKIRGVVDLGEVTQDEEVK